MPLYCYTSNLEATMLLHIQFPSQNIDTHPISKPQYCYTGELKNWYAGAICRIHIISGMQAGGDHEMKKYN